MVKLSSLKLLVKEALTGPVIALRDRFLKALFT